MLNSVLMLEEFYAKIFESVFLLSKICNCFPGKIFIHSMSSTSLYFSSPLSSFYRVTLLILLQASVQHNYKTERTNSYQRVFKRLFSRADILKMWISFRDWDAKVFAGNMTLQDIFQMPLFMPISFVLDSI